MLARYPDTADYSTLLVIVNALNCEKGEQFSDFATRIDDTYSTLKAAGPPLSITVLRIQNDSVQKLVEVCQLELRNFVHNDKPAEYNMPHVLKQILILLETNKHY